MTATNAACMFSCSRHITDFAPQIRLQKFATRPCRWAPPSAPWALPWGASNEALSKWKRHQSFWPSWALWHVSGIKQGVMAILIRIVPMVASSSDRIPYNGVAGLFSRCPLWCQLVISSIVHMYLSCSLASLFRTSSIGYIHYSEKLA